MCDTKHFNKHMLVLVCCDHERFIASREHWEDG